MKILQVCHKPPFPPIDGGCIAINSITQGLINQGNEVKVAAINTQKHPLIDTPEFREYAAKTDFTSVFVDTSLNNWAALKSLLFQKSYHIERFVSKQFSQLLSDILIQEHFDVVLLESLFVAPYISTIRKYSKAKIVIRLHNIEHKVWERLVHNETNIFRKMVLRRMTKLLKNYESMILSKVDGFMTISDVDYNFFHALYPNIPGITIPFGLDMDKYESEEEYLPSDKPELFHIGSMNWLPNREGIEWFLDEVWDQVVENYPEVTFTIAGRDMPEEFKERESDNLKILGEIKDAKGFMAAKDIMIVPILSGSGVRIKIIEGMALGKTIITTTIGAEGLDITDGQNIFIADTPEEFVSVIGKCVQTPDLCTIIGENAMDFVTVHHNNEIITRRITEYFQELLGSERR